MRRRRLLFVTAMALVVVAVTVLYQAWSLKGTRPRSFAHTIEIPSPLRVTVHLLTESDHFKIDGGWSTASGTQPKSVVLVKITNISKRNIILPHYANWNPGITFTTQALFARTPHFFLAPTGEIDWILLKPGESTTGIDDVANYLTFLASGTYHLIYYIIFDYSYAKDDITLTPTKESTLIKSYTTGNFTINQIGNLSVSIAPDQTSWR